MERRRKLGVCDDVYVVAAMPLLSYAADNEAVLYAVFLQKVCCTTKRDCIYKPFLLTVGEYGISVCAPIFRDRIVLVNI